MSKKVIFKIDKDLDFRNHLTGARVALRGSISMSPQTSEYFKNLREMNEEEKRNLFNKRTSKFYSEEMEPIRRVLVEQTQEMWDLIEDRYLNKIEVIHKKSFPLDMVSGILSTTPTVYGYDFHEGNPWFACVYDSPLKAIHTTMHEIMHLFFHKYFSEKYKNKFELSEEQIHKIKESLTIILNLEFSDIRINPDNGYVGHEALREKIKEDWLKYKDFEKVLEEACVYIKMV
jgi:hypothetical protein